jgi:drug/metabolite transporter (DMT)-like permease
MLSLAFCVPLVYAVGNTYIRRSLSGVPAVPLSAAICLLGAAWLLPMLMLPDALLPSGLAGPSQPNRWPAAVAGTAWLAIVGTGLSIAMFIRLLHFLGPLYAGMSSYLVPLVALTWGAYDQEPITWRQLLGMVTVLAMVALVQTEPRPER